MQHDEEMEFHSLFISKLNHLRFALDETGKMMESRLENLTRYVYQGNLKSETFKNSRVEIMKAIDGFKYCVKSLCENLKNEFKTSLEKIDPELEKQTEIEEYKKGA